MTVITTNRNLFKEPLINSSARLSVRFVNGFVTVSGRSLFSLCIFLIFLLHLRVNGGQLISHSFFDKTVQTLLLGNSINGGTFMKQNFCFVNFAHEHDTRNPNF